MQWCREIKERVESLQEWDTGRGERQERGLLELGAALQGGKRHAGGKEVVPLTCPSAPSDLVASNPCHYMYILISMDLL